MQTKATLNDESENWTRIEKSSSGFPICILESNGLESPQDYSPLENKRGGIKNSPEFKSKEGKELAAQHTGSQLDDKTQLLKYSRDK